MTLNMRNIFFTLAAISFVLCACTDTTIIPAGEYDVAGGNPSTGDESTWEVKPIAPLFNPDRGYHLECTYCADDLLHPQNDWETYPKGFIDDRERSFDSEDGSTSLVQQYIYLSRYAQRAIDDQGLQNIQTIFDGLREHGYKAILRIAYNWWGENQYNPNWANEVEREPWIYTHLEQLKPILQQNIGLIAVMQAGFIGRWGEWHNSSLASNQNAKNKVVNKLLEIIPEPYNIGVRYPNHKNSLTLGNESERSRLSYHNDFFTAGEHPYASGNDFVPGDAWYNQVMAEAPRLFILGEMPYERDEEWGFNTVFNSNVGLNIFKEHHYSAFDITQNNSLNIRSWKTNKVTPGELSRNRILFDESYFTEGETKVARTLYDFIRDHLGYRINVKAAELSAEGGSLAYKIDLTNTGFATVMNPKEVYLVFIGEDDQVAKEVKLEVNPIDWQPFDVVSQEYKALIHTLQGTAETSGLTGTYRVGIWIPEVASNLKYNGNYAVKFAVSDLSSPWSDEAGRYAVNVVGEVSL